MRSPTRAALVILSLSLGLQGCVSTYRGPLPNFEARGEKAQEQIGRSSFMSFSVLKEVAPIYNKDLQKRFAP